MYLFVNELFFLGRQVQSEPGMIVGPIAWLFGAILNFMFNIAYAVTPAGNNSLGLAIIMLTVVAMTMMLPLNIKAQRSTIAMQKLNPEIEKIKAKYGNKNDAETKQKIGQETQALWAKHKVNPMGACLPMLIQMPLFFGLLYIMNQSYQYITVLYDQYVVMAQAIQQVPDYLETVRALTMPLVPTGWQGNGAMVQQYVNMGHSLESALDMVGTSDIIVLSIPEHLARVLDRFTGEHWNVLFYGGTVPGTNTVVEGLNAAYHGPLRESFGRMQNIEVFLGLSLKENSGWFPPGVIIPVLSVITMMATSWLSQLVNKSKDQQQKTMGTIMMVVMPLFMGFITVNFPAGVGLYWIISNLYRFVQQFIMNKQAGVPFRLPFTKKDEVEVL
jgi:YidC/Oxa1 family membrane protein insertase